MREDAHFEPADDEQYFAPDVLEGLTGVDHDSGIYEPPVGTLDHNLVVAAWKMLSMPGGFFEAIETRRRDSRHGTSAGGRPGLDYRVVITVTLALMRSQRHFVLQHVSDTIAFGLDPATREFFGDLLTSIDGSDPNLRANLYRRVVRAFANTTNLFEPAPGLAGRRVGRTQHRERLADYSNEHIADRIRATEELGRLLLISSWRLLPRDVRRSIERKAGKKRGWNFGVDSTPIEAWGKGSSPKYVSDDRAKVNPDGFGTGWYLREREDHAPVNEDDKKKWVIHKKIFGREAFLATLTGMGSNNDVPNIVLAMTMSIPGKAITPNFMRAVELLRRSGAIPGRMVTDRGIMPNTKAEEVQLPLRADGWDLTFDYRKDQLGRASDASYAGETWVEGAPCCPGTPEHLIEATLVFRTTGGRRPSKKELLEGSWRDKPEYTPYKRFMELIRERRRYVLAKRDTKANGAIVLQCPAAGANARVVCPKYRPLKKGQKPNGPTVINAPHKADALGLCTNAGGTITVPMTADIAKYAQDLLYGTPEWEDAYGPGRALSEGANSMIKEPAHENIAEPGNRRARGWAKQFFLVALAVVAANIRRIQAWLRKKAKEEAKAAAPGPRTRPARKNDIRRHTPEWTKPEGNEPPDRAEAA